MANFKTDEERKALHQNVLLAAATLFLQNGYTQTSTRQIAAQAHIHISAMNRAYGSKENILCELVEYVLESQFDAAQKIVAGKTEDPVLFYAAETALQIYMAESSEPVRDLYASAYSMPHSSELIRRSIAGKLEALFRQYLPQAQPKDFYELEIASGGIIRGYMMVPCDVYFTMEQKTRRFLEASLRVYQVPEEKIQESLAFVARFDYPRIARQTIEDMFNQLKKSD